MSCPQTISSRLNWTEWASAPATVDAPNASFSEKSVVRAPSVDTVDFDVAMVPEELLSLRISILLPFHRKKPYKAIPIKTTYTKNFISVHLEYTNYIKIKDGN